MEEVGIVHYGVGSIGISIMKLILEKKGFDVVGAVDIDPEKIGKYLNELTGDERLSKVEVTSSLEDVKIDSKVKLVVHTTGSYIRDVLPQIKEITSLGFHTISSCEELSYPWIEHSGFASEIDRLAKDSGVSILGTGVNPGFLMDVLAITLTGLCQKISRIECMRIQDASSRRLPFQRKIGAGLVLEEFEKKVDAGLIGHVGFRESIWMIADSLGWKVDNIIETIKPIVAENRLKSRFLTVEEGQVAGIDQITTGLRKDYELIRLNLQAFLGCESPREEIRIEGFPKIEMEIKGGVHGDFATASVIVNSIPKVINSTPGLHTMRDLPIPSALLGI